jgi:DNA-binding MarR family transcriptional regulator
MVTQVLVTVAQNTARYEDLGVATSGVTMFRLIGGSLGTAALGTVFAGQVAARLAAAGGSATGAAGGLAGLTTERLAALPPEELAAYIEALTGSIGVIFTVAAAVAFTGFVLSLFLPEPPLRETVAASASNIGHEAGEAFAMAASGDPSLELLRGLSVLASRDVQRAYVEGLARRAGVDLIPAAVWLVLRIGEDAAIDVDAAARRENVPPDRVEAGIQQLIDHGYLHVARNRPRAVYTLAPAGCEIYDRLAEARRERLAQLCAQWPPAQRQQVAFMLERFARELVPPHESGLTLHGSRPAPNASKKHNVGTT